jgi:predicted MFS family arabinose efflux permease
MQQCPHEGPEELPRAQISAVNSNASSAVLAVPDPARLSAGLLFLLAVSCGVIVANLYYAQPLVGPISTSIGLAPSASGLIVTLTQVGYGLGLLLIVPLADLIENRRLVVSALLVTLAALLAAALSTYQWLFLTAAFVIGLSCVAAQVLVPYAAHFTPEAHRGRAVGNVMTGLLLGIMLSRPIASVVAGVWSWHAVYCRGFLRGGVELFRARLVRVSAPGGGCANSRAGVFLYRVRSQAVRLSVMCTPTLV